MKQLAGDSALGVNNNMQSERQAAEALNLSNTKITKEDAAHTQCTKDYLLLCNEQTRQNTVLT